MRIGIARLWQETNTFSPRLTSLDDFSRYGIHVGEEVLRHLDAAPELSGAAAAAEKAERPVEIVPIFCAMAWPSGTLGKEAHDHLANTFLDALTRCGHLDGLFVSLHGALAAEGCDDVEADLLARIKDRYGKPLPISISLDMHANITRRMAEHADIMVGYRTCPHLDVEETGYKAMGLLLQAVAGRIAPMMNWRKIPMVVPADRHDHSQGPLHELMSLLDRVEQRAGVLSTSLFAVQPWLDVEELGWGSVVVTDGDPDLARASCDEIAEACWRHRGDFIVSKLSPELAVREAMRTPGKPVVISDSADATNSGAPGNSTWLLKALLDAQVGERAFLTMVAPEAARAAHRAGVGAVLEVEFGAMPENPYSRPISVRARVRSLHDGSMSMSGHLGKNLTVQMGKTAVLEVANHFIVTSEAAGPGHVPPDFFAAFGLDVRDAKIVVAKSPVGFRAAYKLIAAGVILCDAPGPATSDLPSLGFKHRPKPLYPFESGFRWSPN
jgi:microcystin degradation protein MlrC